MNKLSFKIDSSIIKKAQTGDKIAFDQITLFYHKKVFNFSRRYLAVREDAEDVTQEVFLKVYKNIKKYDFRTSFSTWLFTIAKNTIYDTLRKSQKHHEIKIEDISNIETKIVTDIEKTSEKINRQVDVALALSEIKPEYQKVIKLFYWGGLGYKEIARVMKIPINTVRTYLRRAKKSMAVFFGKPFKSNKKRK